MTPEERAMLQAAREYERQQQEEGIAFATSEFMDDDDDYPLTAEEIMDEVGECDPNALL